MLVVDTPQRFGVAAPRCGAAFGGRPELLQMQIADADLVERCRKLTLGKSRPARRRDRAGIDEQLDLGVDELFQHGGRLCLFVADREQAPGLCRFSFRLRPHLSLSISAMAAAGARIFASWIK